MLEVLTALRQHARERPGSPAFSDGLRNVSYRQLLTLSNAVAWKVRDLPDVIAILAPNGIDWVAGWLGLAMAGKTIVTLPPFFSNQQLSHIVGDSGTGHILSVAELKPVARSLGLGVSVISEFGDDVAYPDVAGDLAAQSRHIVYTSGTTGAPKGVRLGASQIDWSAAALKRAVHAGPSDHYLSVLPFALLLEQICGICVPILAAAPVTIAADVAAALMAGNPSKLLEAMERTLPSISVLVPEFLAEWTAALQAQGGMAPATLRYVAVGGAPLAPALATQAESLGIPVHEGYGLTECCSVVALGRPGQQQGHSVGKPLDGLDVSIVEGEIVVSGPSLMDGYLHGDERPQCWATGDLGSIDEQGNLRVTGRRDNLLVLSNGRNVSPEWIEAMIVSDLKIAGCTLEGHGETRTVALITPSPSGIQWFAGASAEEINQLVAELCREAPHYARPGTCRIVNQPDLASTG